MHILIKEIAFYANLLIYMVGIFGYLITFGGNFLFLNYTK